MRREVSGPPDQTHRQKAIHRHHPGNSNRGRDIPADKGKSRTQDGKRRHDPQWPQKAREINGNRVQHGDDDAHWSQKIDKKDTDDEGADDERKPGVIAEQSSRHAGLYHRLSPFNCITQDFT